MDVGFAKAGFRTAVVAELDVAACQTLEANKDLIGHTGSAQIIPTSVCDLNLEGSKSLDFDVVFGGPPCQGFSVAGKMDPDDERSTLVYDFMRLVKEVSPKSFVMENVKALAVSDRWERIRRKIARLASEAGYATALIVLNATDYGVPQARERMFFIGVRKDLLAPTDINLRNSVLAELQEHKALHPTLRTIIERFGPSGSQGNPATCTAKIMYAKAPILRKSPYAGMMFNGAGRPIPVNGASPTLPASMGGNKTPIVDEAEIFEGESSYIERYHAHLMRGGKAKTGEAPRRLRRLTISECAAIQTFPANYSFKGSKSSIYKQIGNAVPCQLAFVVASSLAAILEKCEASKTLVAAE